MPIGVRRGEINTAVANLQLLAPADIVRSMNTLLGSIDFFDDYSYCDLLFSSLFEMLDDEEPSQYLYRHHV